MGLENRLQKDWLGKKNGLCKDALASSGVDVKRMNEVLEATAVEHE